MKFSIIIPSFNNSDYLKLCIDSIKKNSCFDHQIIVHINGPDTETEKYVNKINVYYTKTNENVGLCKGVNIASKKSNTNYIVYAHDDMYFLPNWDIYLKKEIELLPDNLFYLSCTQLSHYKKGKGEINHIHFDAGNSLSNFNESKLLDNYEKLSFHNLQGSHWAPHVIHKDIWNKINGFSEEFDPGFGSDPDLNMKLWNIGVRIFKGVNKSRVYHFGSLTTRKNNDVTRNNGRKTFLLKWKISIDFFVKYYLKRGNVYEGPLHDPKKNLSYFISILRCKINYIIAKI